MKNNQSDFKQFIREREKASEAYVNGEVAPLNRVSTQVSPATIFGPMGTCVEGAKKVNAANAQGAKSFGPGGETHFEFMQRMEDDNLAFWAGIQRAKVRLQGKKKPIQMDLRVTEIFRREKGAWKLIHRHADPLKTTSKNGKK